jgi:glyoxylase-like metal-dependent hydrolase (beta-lactamase superfamily II)
MEAMIMISRRSFLRGAALAAAGSMMGRAALPAAAAAVPKVSRQAPGVFRMMLGDVEITALYDGGVSLSPQLLHGASPQDVDALLEEACIEPKAGFPASINAFLINNGQNLILIDTGVGTYFGNKGGLLPESLRAAGYDPEQIDTVLLTHLHSDHALGLVDGSGKPLFTKATVLVHEAEASYWLANGAENRVTDGQRKVLPALRAAVAPYQAAGTFKTFATGALPVPGLEAELIAGHTPGHCGYGIRSQTSSLLFWGDVVHCLPVQFPRPAVTIDFDTVQGQAFPAREKVMAQSAREKRWVAGAHLPFPGIGHVQARDSGYTWLPAMYAALPTS